MISLQVIHLKGIWISQDYEKKKSNYIQKHIVVREGHNIE